MFLYAAGWESRVSEKVAYLSFYFYFCPMI